MPRTREFFIPDTSPIFAYSPLSTGGGWTAAYGPKGDGYDQTFHQANLTTSIISLNITASSLRVSTAASGCDASISLNGSAFSNACSGGALEGVPAGRHAVVIRPEKDGGAFQFLGIGGTVEVDTGGASKSANKTLDSSSLAFAYSTGWTFLSNSGVTGASGANLSAEYNDTRRFFNGTGSVTTVSGAMVNLTFEAAAIQLYGVSGPGGGAAEVRLDGEVVQTLNLSNPWTAYSSLFYTSTFNGSDTHQLSVVNLQEGSALALDYAVLTVPSNSSWSSDHLALLLGLISGISAALLLLGVSAYCYHVRRRQPRPEHTPKGYGFSTSSSSVDKWHQIASPSLVTPKTGSSGIGGSWRGPNAKVEDLQVFGWRGKGDGGKGMPSPEYPDYVPYRGPVETRPTPDRLGGKTPTSASTSSHEPPSIAGANAMAKGWLEARRDSPPGTASTHQYGLGGPGYTLRVAPPVAVPPSLVVRAERGRAMDEIPLDSYYVRQQSHPGRSDGDIGEGEAEPLTASSGTTTAPSSLGVAGIMTAQAVGATRSVARLWATSSSAYDQQRNREEISLGDHVSGCGGQASSGLLTTPLPTICTSDLGLSFPRAPTPSDLPTTSPVSPPSGLRRGVSIKSVKTMRSFFSALVHPPAAGAVPATPALSTPQAAARPDSDIFPVPSRSRSIKRIAVPPFDAGGATYAGEQRGGDGNGSRLDLAALGATDSSPNMFIELDPNSPVTAWSPARGSLGTSLGGRAFQF